MARMERGMNAMCRIKKRRLLLQLVIKLTDDFARLMYEDFSKAG